eukprot:13757934-Ditylum_brightwellii.AAC.1
MIDKASDVMRGSSTFDVLKDHNGEYNEVFAVPFVFDYPDFVILNPSIHVCTIVKMDCVAIHGDE